MKDILINGKVYPMWQQFVQKKQEWIGGTLQDFGDSMDKSLGITGEEPMSTKITDIKLSPNGLTSAFFEVEGEHFGCGFSTGIGGIGGTQEKPWITFSGYMGHKWRIKKLNKTN